MSKRILAIGASNSSTSINRRLAGWAAGQVPDAIVHLVDLNDYEMPIYSIDREKATGIPQLAHDFKQLIRDTDGIVISFAEHNGAYATAFKNIFDWISRVEKQVWYEKPMFLMATSPGGRGGKTVLDIATAKFQRMNPNAVAVFSLPTFNNNFSDDAGITDENFLALFQEQLQLFLAALGMA